MKQNRRKCMLIACIVIVIMGALFNGCKKDDKYIQVTSIDSNPSACIVQLGAEKTITAHVLPQDATIKQIGWSSTNPSVATVNDAGIAKGLLLGSSLIIAESLDKGLKDTTMFFVVPTPDEDDYASLVPGFYFGKMTMRDSVQTVVSERSMITVSYSNNKQVLLAVNDYFVIAQMGGIKLPIKVSCSAILEKTNDGYFGTGNTSVSLMGYSLPVKLEVLFYNDNMDLAIFVNNVPIMGNITVDFKGNERTNVIATR